MKCGISNLKVSFAISFFVSSGRVVAPNLCFGEAKLKLCSNKMLGNQSSGLIVACVSDIKNITNN